MSSTDLWGWFRKLRTILFASAAILCFIWTILIAVYLGRNWSTYNGGQRGFLCGLIALDFISSILLYLMIVVKYRFWPDAARTAVLVGLHVAGTVVFELDSPRFPCNAFGSTAHCHGMTIAVIAGSWVISGLLIAYAIFLPVMAVIPSPPTPKASDGLETPPLNPDSEEEKRKTHVSSRSQAWLLHNPEGTSPELNASDLPAHRGIPSIPRPHSHASSSSSFDLRPISPARVDVVMAAGEPNTPSTTSVYSVLSPRSSAGRTIRAPSFYTTDRAVNASNSSSESSEGYPASRSGSLLSHPLPNRFRDGIDERRMSTLSDSTTVLPENAYYDFPTADGPAGRPTSHPTIASPYSVSAYESSASRRPYRTRVASGRQSIHAQNGAIGNRVAPTSPLASSAALPDTPAHSVHSMMASVHDHPDLDMDSNARTSRHSETGFLSPPLTALPTPRYASGSSPSTFELHLSDTTRSNSVDVGDLIDMASVPIRRGSESMHEVRNVPHVRNDSLGSNVDLNEWKRHVLLAAGRPV
ncbi:hypothetical protein BV22DRAFT_1036216 [Leucogyrophana mollusca]|uniref:Uncharacterized protein n=1 Tax=Leucogyrophana mollusca TaxID=85980 RepID=A0ACB8BCU0_9AGAM|nr:hypothetical protein BV22DRAFT_1036216 [Leucogyrophana mollusca]